MYSHTPQDVFVSLLLESLGEAAARRRGAGNLASLCAWARNVYDVSARSSLADADVSASQGFETCMIIIEALGKCKIGA